MSADQAHYTVIDYVRTREIPGARTLKEANWHGLTFAVGKDIKDDDLVVIFLPDGQVSEEYATEHDLVGYTDPDTGEHKGGFFKSNRKVKPISLMSGKIKSVGYVAPVSTLAFTGVDMDTLKPGMYFSELNGVPISNKFVTKATEQQRRKARKEKARERNGFLRHQNTIQGYSLDAIPAGSLVSVSEKLDGTSFRAGWGWKEPEREGRVKGFVKKLLSIPSVEVPAWFVGSRNVVYEEGDDAGLYGKVAEKYDLRSKLRVGETLYGEIVGYGEVAKYSGESKLIFVRGGVEFRYGVADGESLLYVYAITRTTPDGDTIYLSVQQTVARCADLGLNYVPIIKKHKIIDDTRDDEEVKQLCNHEMHGNSLLDRTHIREGVVLRVDDDWGRTTFYKFKSPEYYALEDAFKDAGKADIEEIN